MAGRLLVTLSFLVCVALERFAWYGFRSQFLVVQAVRGVDRDSASELFGQLTSVATLLQLGAAAVAFFAPRPWVAVAGVVVATGSYALAILGEQATFAAAVMGLAVGVAFAKATLLCAAAEFMTSARARLVVVIFGYAMVNGVGALVPFLSPGAPGPGFSVAPLVAAVLLTVLCLGGAVAGQVTGTPDLRGSSVAGGLGVIAVALLPQGFLWLMVEAQPFDLDLPVWAPLLNPVLVTLLTLPLALVFGLVPPRWLPSLAAAIFIVGALASGAGLAGLGTRDPRVWAGVTVLLTFAECAVSMLGIALVVSLSSARVAPFALTLNSVLTARMSGLSMLPEDSRRATMLVLGALSLVAIVVLVVVRRPLLEPLSVPADPAAG